MRRSLFGNSTILFAALALAACGGGGAAPASSGPASASPAASKPAAAASAAPASAAASKPAAAASGSAAAKPAGSAAAGTPIKIGYINSTTGSLANVGQYNDDAFQLYLDSIGNTVAGRKIQVTFADDAGAAPDLGLNKAKQLVEGDKVNLLMGLTSTPICYAVAGYAKQAEVPLIVSGNCGAEALMYDSKTVSPYTVRFTQNGTEVADTLADYAYKKGYRKVGLLMSDYGGGLETNDAFASAFVGRGGSIVQEIHPPLGTNDMGPYVSQINSNADALITFTPGIDALRFDEAFATYGGASKLPVLDHFGGTISGPNYVQAKDKVAGFTGNYAYSPALDTPANQALVKAWTAKYPDRGVSTDVGVGWAAGQYLEAAIKAVNGNVEDKQGFMNALYGLKVDTVKGPISLDAQHDVVQNIYFWEAQKSGNSTALKVVDTYQNVSRTWDRTQDQIAKFQFGTYKGKWVGMTKEQLGDVLTLPK